MFDHLKQSNNSQQSSFKQDHFSNLDPNKNINFLPGGSKGTKKRKIHFSKVNKKDMSQPVKIDSKHHLQDAPSFLIKLKSIFKSSKKTVVKKDLKLSITNPQNNNITITPKSAVDSVSKISKKLDQPEQDSSQIIKKTTPIYSTRITTPTPAPATAKIQTQSTISNSSKKNEPLIKPSNNNPLHQVDLKNNSKEIDDSLEVNLLPVKKKHFSVQQIFMSYIIAIVVCLLATITPYIYFLTNNRSLSTSIVSLTSQIDVINNKNKELSDQVKLMKPFSLKLQSLLSLLENHVYWSRFYSVLEDYTIGNVYYTSLSMDGDNLVNLSGAALNLRDLAEQLVVLQQASVFVDVNLDSFVFVEQEVPSDPRIEFTLNFTLSPEIIKENFDTTDKARP